MEEERCSLVCQAPEPYPPVRAEGRNPRYGAAMLDNMGGSSSEMSTVSRYLYAQMVTAGIPEVAEAFRILKKAGKVRAFGVSNHNPMQIELLNSCLEEPLCVNQIQFSVAHCPTIDAGLNVNIHNDAGYP